VLEAPESPGLFDRAQEREGLAGVAEALGAWVSGGEGVITAGAPQPAVDPAMSSRTVALTARCRAIGAGQS